MPEWLWAVGLVLAVLGAFLGLRKGRRQYSGALQTAFAEGGAAAAEAAVNAHQTTSINVIAGNSGSDALLGTPEAMRVLMSSEYLKRLQAELIAAGIDMPPVSQNWSVDDDGPGLACASGLDGRVGARVLPGVHVPGLEVGGLSRAHRSAVSAAVIRPGGDLDGRWGAPSGRPQYESSVTELERAAIHRYVTHDGPDPFGPTVNGGA